MNVLVEVEAARRRLFVLLAGPGCRGDGAILNYDNVINASASALLF